MDKIVLVMLLIGAANGFWLWVHDIFVLAKKISKGEGKRNGH